MRTKNNLVRAAAIGGVATLALTMGSPAYAAPDDVVGQSSAAAVELRIGGQGADSGRVTAKVQADGDEVVTGEANPPIDVLDNQQLLNAGVLAQEANAFLDGRRGISEACSGVAGEGGEVVEIGDSGCLTPGQPVDLSIANLDLTGVQLADEEGALAPLNQLGDPVVEQVLGPVTEAISNALADTITGSIGGTFGAIQAFCNASPGQASGSAELVDSFITARFSADEAPVTLLTLPANPAPNTEVVTDLDEVVDLLLEDLRAELNEGFNGLAAPLAAAIDPIQENLVRTVVRDIANQLQPLEDNVLRATLNKQTTTGDGQISVTALDLDVLPAAQQSPLGAPLVEAIIANVTCGPNSVVSAGNPEGPQGPASPEGPSGPGNGPALPEVPTAVDSGAEGQHNGTLLGGLMLALAGAVAATGYRRASSKG